MLGRSLPNIYMDKSRRSANPAESELKSVTSNNETLSPIANSNISSNASRVLSWAARFRSLKRMPRATVAAGNTKRYAALMAQRIQGVNKLIFHFIFASLLTVELFPGEIFKHRLNLCIQFFFFLRVFL